MSRRTIVLFAVVALAAIALSACGGGATGGGAPAPLSVTITATEFKYDPQMINAAPGQTINITLKNIGSVDHTFVFAPANFKMTVAAGKSDTKTFTAPAAGTYDFTCDVAGHKEAGMVGKLIVK